MCSCRRQHEVRWKGEGCRTQLRVGSGCSHVGSGSSEAEGGGKGIVREQRWERCSCCGIGITVSVGV